MIKYTEINIMSLIYAKPDKHLVVYLRGGLGNQLFQIVNGYVLSRRWNAVLHIRTDEFHCGQGSHPSKYFDSIYSQFISYFDTHVYDHMYNETTWSYYNVNKDICQLFETKNTTRARYLDAVRQFQEANLS